MSTSQKTTVATQLRWMLAFSGHVVAPCSSSMIFKGPKIEGSFECHPVDNLWPEQDNNAAVRSVKGHSIKGNGFEAAAAKRL